MIGQTSATVGTHTPQGGFYGTCNRLQMTLPYCRERNEWETGAEHQAILIAQATEQEMLLALELGVLLVHSVPYHSLGMMDLHEQ